MNGLHANICVLRIDAVQVERVYIFVQWKFVWEKIKMSVTSAYIEWTFVRLCHPEVNDVMRNGLADKVYRLS